MNNITGGLFCPATLGAYNPFLLKGMNDALSRIVEAVNKRERIIIYGCCDLDGIIAVSLLWLLLKYLNADVEYFIPDHIDKNFNINSDNIKNHIKFLGANLIITVGCGINSVSQVELCKDLGIDIIITDYHKCVDTVPKTIIINPNQIDCRYPSKELSGVGVVYKLGQAIASYYQIKCINKYLDLVLLGTLSHNVPLRGENKLLTEQGMHYINLTKNYGLKALMKVYNIDKFDSENIKKLIFNMVLWTKTARYYDNARITVELFTTSNIDRAEQIAKYLKKQIYV